MYSLQGVVQTIWPFQRITPKRCLMKIVLAQGMLTSFLFSGVMIFFFFIDARQCIDLSVIWFSIDPGNTVEYCYNMVQFIMILYTVLRWKQQKVNQTSNSQQTPGHPILHLHGRAMMCLSWQFGRKLTTLWWHCTVTCPLFDTSLNSLGPRRCVILQVHFTILVILQVQFFSTHFMNGYLRLFLQN